MSGLRQNVCVTIAMLFLWIVPVRVDTSVESFYRGQNLRILVGYGPGTGYDVYARVLGRHISRFLPGQPTIVVQNMPGAASLTMTNNLYNVAPRDGLTIGIPARNLLMEPVYGNDNARFDARKFTWIGSMNRETATCFVWAATGLTVILVTHDVDEAVYLSDRVAVLSANPGRIARVFRSGLTYPRHAIATREEPKFIASRHDVLETVLAAAAEART